MNVVLLRPREKLNVRARLLAIGRNSISSRSDVLPGIRLATGIHDVGKRPSLIILLFERNLHLAIVYC